MANRDYSCIVNITNRQSRSVGALRASIEKASHYVVARGDSPVAVFVRPSNGELSDVATFCRAARAAGRGGLKVSDSLALPALGWAVTLSTDCGNVLVAAFAAEEDARVFWHAIDRPLPTCASWRFESELTA